MAESNVKLRVDARSAVTSLQQTNRASQKLNETLGTTSKRAGTATANIQRFGISFRSVVGPMVALTGALTLANKSLNTFGKRQADLKVLATQLERIGAGGSEQLDKLKAAADELGDATLFSQDDFIESFNILSSFRAIAVDSFTEVSEVAADIAQVMGSDVKSATVQLAKALEDPKRGLTALSRSGITFNETQTETIKKLVDSGNLLNAQALILDTIKSQYEGAGEAAGKGFAGALDLLSENASDAAEALGKGLEPAATTAANALAAVFEEISKIPAPAGQAAIQIGLITAGVIALNKAIVAFKATKLAAFLATQIALYKTFGAQIYVTAAAQGALNVALGIGKALMIGLPLLAVAGGIIGIADALNQAINGQKDFNNLLKDGTVEMLENALATKKSSLALQERMMLQGRGEARAADTSRLNRLQQEVADLEARLVEKRAEKPKPKPTPRPTPLVTLLNLDGKPKSEAKGKTDLEKQQEAAADLLKNLKERTTLATALTSDEQKMLQLRINQANVEEDFSLLSTEIQGKLKEQYETLFAQENVTQALKDAAADRAKKEKEIAEAAAEQAKKLEELYQRVGTAIENGIVNGIMGAIEGTKSLQESLADVLRDVGKLFLQFAVKTGLNAISPSVFPMAEGGYVSGPTNALIGEGGEPEYVIPESKMRESMSRYSRGSRGSSVIPEVGGSGASSGGGGLAVAAPIDVRYTVERINSVDYVTADQFQNGMQQAATQGAKQGEQATLKRLQMSGSTRKRIGI